MQDSSFRAEHRHRSREAWEEGQDDEDARLMTQGAGVVLA
jgi:hypothetical protein